MEDKLARIISFLLHPLLIPSYFLIILYQLSGFIYPLLSLHYKLVFLGFVFTSTFLVPSALALVLKKLKVIETLTMEKRNERMIPLFLVAVMYFVTFLMMQRISMQGYRIFAFFMLGSTILILLALSLNYFTKVSLHLMAWGGLTGALIGISMLFRIDLYFWLFLVISLSGTAAYARLRLKAHRPYQVYTGYLLGMVIMMLLFLFV